MKQNYIYYLDIRFRINIKMLHRMFSNKQTVITNNNKELPSLK